MARRNFIHENMLVHVGDSLGDLFVSCGLTHHFAQNVKQTYVCCKDPKYFDTIQSLYSETPRLTVVNYEEFLALFTTIPSNFYLKGIQCCSMPTRYSNGDYGSLDVAWERQMYDNFDLPFSVRYKQFKLPSHIEGSHELKERLTNGAQEYIIVNRYMGGELNKIHHYIDGFNPNNYPVIEIEPDTTTNVLQYVELFKSAKQIHVLPTSIHQLVDGMTHLISGDLFFHDIRRNFCSPVNCQWNEFRWNIVSYTDKR